MSGTCLSQTGHQDTWKTFTTGGNFNSIPIPWAQWTQTVLDFCLNLLPRSIYNWVTMYSPIGLVRENILVCSPWYQLWPLYLILINLLFLKHKPEIDCGSDSERERRVILTQTPRWASRGWHRGPCTSTCSSPCLSCQSSLPSDCSMLQILLLISPTEEVMLCWLHSVTQRHHCFNRSWPWPEIWVALAGLGNDKGQDSPSGLEQHSRIYIHTTKLSCFSVHPGSTPWLLFHLNQSQAVLQAGTVRVEREVDGLTTELTIQL